MTSLNRLGEEAIKQRAILSCAVLGYICGMVADAELAEVVLKTNLDKIEPMKIGENLIGNGILLAPVPMWRVRRKKIVHWSACKNIRQFVDVFNRNSSIMTELLAEKAGQGAFSVWRYLSANALDSICETTMNVKLNALCDPNQPFFYSFEIYCEMMVKRAFSPWLYNNTFYSSLPWYWKLDKHIKRMHAIVTQMIKENRSVPKSQVECINDTYDDEDSGPKNLLYYLKKPFSNGACYSDLEMRNELLTMLLAGSDTTATAQGFILTMLAAYQHEQDLVYKEVQDLFRSSTRPVTLDDVRKTKYLDAFIKETLRLYPPIPIVGRKIEKDTPLPSGLVIPANMQMIINLWAISRNPHHWGEDVLQFRPSRFMSGELLPSSAFVTFSLGPKNCIGYEFAMTSLKITTINILRKYRVLHAQEFKNDQMLAPLRLKYEIMLKDVDNYTIRLEKR